MWTYGYGVLSLGLRLGEKGPTRCASLCAGAKVLAPKRGEARPQQGARVVMVVANAPAPSGP